MGWKIYNKSKEISAIFPEYILCLKNIFKFIFRIRKHVCEGVVSPGGNKKQMSLEAELQNLALISQH